MLTLRMIMTTQEILDTALMSKIWIRKGSKWTTNWYKWEKLLFVVDGGISALAEITGELGKPESSVGSERQFVQAIPIHVTRIYALDHRIMVGDRIEGILHKEWGEEFSRKLVDQNAITGSNAVKIYSYINKF
jgi:hypothetical protein